MVDIRKEKEDGECEMAIILKSVGLENFIDVFNDEKISPDVISLLFLIDFKELGMVFQIGDYEPLLEMLMLWQCKTSKGAISAWWSTQIPASYV